MPRRANRRNVQWETPEKDFQWHHVRLEVLMDIRERLASIDQSLMPLRCSNFIAIPHVLRNISRHVARIPARKKKTKRDA